eukprot:2021097-Lingulodinium_polyedra.AAC.1
MQAVPRGRSWARTRCFRGGGRERGAPAEGRVYKPELEAFSCSVGEPRSERAMPRRGRGYGPECRRAQQ